MGDSVRFNEKQYLGYNKFSFFRRMILALFCFIAYYWSEGQNKSGDILFIIGCLVIAFSAI